MTWTRLQFQILSNQTKTFCSDFVGLKEEWPHSHSLRALYNISTHPKTTVVYFPGRLFPKGNVTVVCWIRWWVLRCNPHGSHSVKQMPRAWHGRVPCTTEVGTGGTVPSSTRVHLLVIHVAECSSTCSLQKWAKFFWVRTWKEQNVLVGDFPAYAVPYSEMQAISNVRIFVYTYRNVPYLRFAAPYILGPFSSSYLWNTVLEHYCSPSCSPSNTLTEYGR